MEFTIIKNHEIDKRKWDQFIDNSIHPQIYAMSWYLDLFAPDWNALILGDWDLVVPLPVKKKIGLPYLIHPLFCQQLGCFSTSEINQDVVDLVIRVFRRHYVFVNYQFNRYTPQNYCFNYRRTYELSLLPSYEQLSCQFSASHKKNLRRAMRFNLDVKSSNDCHAMVELMKQMYCKKNIEGVKYYHYLWLNLLFERGIQNGDGRLYFAYNPSGEKIGGAYFFRHAQQTVIFSARNDEGFESKATFLLVDAFLKDQAGSGGYLDFAGSDIKGVAEFNAGWGADSFSYPVINMNFFR